MFCKDNARWLFRLEENYTHKSGLKFDRDYAFMDKQGKVRLILEAEGLITVTKRYAWDGCSPKGCFFDLVVGTPDGVVDVRTGKPKTYYASLIHDAMYQFLADGLPIRRIDAEKLFLKKLSEVGFRPRHIYYFFVLTLGWLFWRGNRRIRQTSGTRIQLSEA